MLLSDHRHPEQQTEGFVNLEFSLLSWTFIGLPVEVFWLCWIDFHILGSIKSLFLKQLCPFCSVPDVTTVIIMGPVHADVTELSWLFNQFTSEGSDWASSTLSYGPWSVAGLRLRDGVRTSQRLPEGDSLPGSARCWSWRNSPGLRTGTWTFMFGSSIQKWILNLVFGLTARFTQQMAAPRWDSIVGSLTYKHVGL